MGVLMQAFYWDCPRDLTGETWWNHVRAAVPRLKQAGITALWLPPVHKAGNVTGPSMGYDPYDYYDLGEFDQRGGIPTWFGDKQELLALIAAAHQHGLQVLADVVINHNNGADAQEVNEIDGQSRWTSFSPASTRFARDRACFHPSRFETWDLATFGDMPDLVHRNPYVYGEILKLTRWLVEEVGFDGFRYDFVKGYGSWLITAIQEYRYARGGAPIRPFGVGENWSSPRTIENWVNETNAWNDNPVSAFDFPGRDMLKALCDWYGFDLRSLASWETFARAQPARAVTFVENHDLRDGDQPIHHDKLLAYAYILTHEGYPCVFWKDYFVHGLALSGSPNGIDALIEVHEQFAGGDTAVLRADADLYVAQRTGYADTPGLIVVINNRGDRWNGGTVRCRWSNRPIEARAWWSATDRSQPDRQWVHSDGAVEVWAPPRGYAVFVPAG